jgi:hypothetical protein
MKNLGFSAPSFGFTFLVDKLSETTNRCKGTKESAICAQEVVNLATDSYKRIG